MRGRRVADGLDLARAVGPQLFDLRGRQPSSKP